MRLKTDFEYPKTLHESHNDYPFTPDNIEIEIEILANYRLENVDDYNISVEILTSKPCYVAQRTFDNDLGAIHKIKATLTLKKPAYVGIFILELSKVAMYEFHYDYMKNKYGNKSIL